MLSTVTPPNIPSGQIRSFGPIGPRYKVGDKARQAGDGDWLVEVTMIETGETAEYRLTHLLDDPAAN